MRNQMSSLVVCVGALLFSLPAAAQIYTVGSVEQKEAAQSAKPPKYDPHDLSGIWRGPSGPVFGKAPAPPMTEWGQEQFNARKPSLMYSDPSRKVPPALGNDPLGNCDPLGYPRNLGDPPGAGGGTFEFVQTPTKLLQIFDEGRRIREIWTDGRKIPDDVEPRWYGWATGRWEGNSLIVDSFGYDERSWLEGNGSPHSDQMKLHEVYHHPDAMTLEITMTLDDPQAYTKPWVGDKQTFHLTLPKEQTVMYEYYCVPSEEETFNRGVRNPAGGDLENSRPLEQQ